MPGKKKRAKRKTFLFSVEVVLHRPMTTDEARDLVDGLLVDRERRLAEAIVEPLAGELNSGGWFDGC